MGTLSEDLWTFMKLSRSVLRMRKVSGKLCSEYQNTYFVFNTFFFLRKSYPLWDNLEKYCRTRKATDDNLAQAICTLYNLSYNRKLRKSNSYISTATMVTS